MHASAACTLCCAPRECWLNKGREIAPIRRLAFRALRWSSMSVEGPALEHPQVLVVVDDAEGHGAALQQGMVTFPLQERPGLINVCSSKSNDAFSFAWLGIDSEPMSGGDAVEGRHRHLDVIEQACGIAVGEKDTVVVHPLWSGEVKRRIWRLLATCHPWVSVGCLQHRHLDDLREL